MNINNINLGHLGLNGKDASKIDRGDNKQSLNAPHFVSKTSQANGHSLEARVSHWTSQFRELPETREDIVASAREKLQNGYYGSREAVEQTARNILGQ